MSLAADMGRHSGRATPFLHDGPYRQFETATGGRSTYLLPNPVQTNQVTSMHRIHHSTLLPESNRNYGFNLSCWDRLFGSYNVSPARPQETMPIGLDQFRSRREAWLDRLLIIPFLRG